MRVGICRSWASASLAMRCSSQRMLSQCLEASINSVSGSRCLHHSAEDEDKYLELKQLRDIKSEDFYELHAQDRKYFYYIDLQGRLFLENTRPKNIATSLKSAKFLRFFFAQIRPNTVADKFAEYPYRSPCGKEMNFIKCADRPFVFDDLKRDPTHPERWLFNYGGGELQVPFQPDRLKISLSTGRLYHDIQTKYITPGTSEGIALVRSQLAVELGKSIDVYELRDSTTNSKNEGEEGVEEDVVIGDFVWEGKRYPIHAIE